MKRIKLGEVGVDSGQLLICDPCYIENEYQFPDSDGKADHAHIIYKNKNDGKLWQFCYGEKPPNPNVNPFAGTYEDIIPEYGLKPNELIEEGIFEKTDIDPTPHIPDNEFSYRGICKTTGQTTQGGQLNYLLGHAGAGVAFRSGFGDGTYEVFAEIENCGDFGERIKRVTIELITEDSMREMEDLIKPEQSN